MAMQSMTTEERILCRLSLDLRVREAAERLLVQSYAYNSGPSGPGQPNFPKIFSPVLASRCSLYI